MSTETESATLSPELAAFFERADAALPPDGADPAAPVKPAAAPPAPAPDLKPFEARFSELKETESKIAAREAALADREKTLPSETAFRTDPVGELRRLARKIVGDDDAKVTAFLAENVYEELMLDIVGAKEPDKLDPGIRNRMEVRRLSRSLEAEKEAREQERKEAARLSEARVTEEKIGQAKAGLSKWYQSKGSDYPHLTHYSANPAEDIYQIMLADEKLSPIEAAAVAEKHYARERERFSKPLPGRAPAAGPSAKTTEPPPVQGERPSLSNSGATEGIVHRNDSPPEDPVASKEYWADMLERDPNAVAAFIKPTARRF